MSRGQERSLAAGDDDTDGLLAGGERALLVEGDLRASRTLFDAAHRRAEREADGPAMARAALGLGGLWAHEHRTAVEAAAIRVRQRDALRGIDPQSSLALRLRIRLAGEEDYRTGGHAAVLALADQARNAGDPTALAEALSLAHLCVLGPGHGPLRLRLGQELIDEASRTGRRIDLLMGMLWHTVDLFSTASPHARRRLAELRELLAQGNHLVIGYAYSAMEVMLAIRAGRFERAEALAADCADLGVAAGDVNTTGWQAGQLGTIRWYQGRAGELVPLLSGLMDSSAMSVVDHSSVAGLALAAATVGDTCSAASALARVSGRDLADLPRSSTWLMTLYCVAEAAYLLDDAETAARAYALLAPYAHLPVLAGLAVTCLGSVHHSLGVASLTAGDANRAVEHLRRAVRGNLALGHWPAVALSRSRLGRALVLRDGPHDETAQRELAQAAREAAELGMNPPLPPAERPAVATGAPCHRPTLHTPKPTPTTPPTAPATGTRDSAVATGATSGPPVVHGASATTRCPPAPPHAPAPVNGDPAGTHGGPTSANGDPAITHGGPAPANGDPTATTGDPTSVSGDPAITHGDPPPANVDPTATTGGPAPANGDPTATTGDPTSVSGDPAITHGDPPPANGDPTATTGGPAALNGDPAITNGGPAITHGGPASVSGDSAETNGGLAAVNGGPAIANGGTASVNGDPASVSGGPAVMNGGPAAVNGAHAGTRYPATSASASAGGPATARCTRLGRHWRIELRDRAALVEHSVGMRYLAILLANPGDDILAAELAAGMSRPGPLGTGAGTGMADPVMVLAGDSAQPILDGQAKREYKRRLSQLQAEIDAAEEAGEAERAAAAGSERAWLIAELAATAGLGGRTRHFANGDERARIAVGKAIRRALDRIAAADPAIGAEMRTTIHTGRRCCYRPA